jgi:hypothetical protein
MYQTMIFGNCIDCNDAVSKRFEGVTKKEIHTAVAQLEYVSKSRVFSYLNTKSTGGGA